MELNEKDSGDEPKKLWLHGRVVSTAMDMPQSKRNESDIFAAQARGQSGKSTRGSIRFDSPRADRALGFDRDEPSLQSGSVFR
jgi:hypothetical protein